MHYTQFSLPILDNHLHVSFTNAVVIKNSFQHIWDLLQLTLLPEMYHASIYFIHYVQHIIT